MLAGMMAFSSCRTMCTMRAAVVEMPYSVQYLPEKVTQPPPMDSFFSASRSKRKRSSRLGPLIKRHAVEADAGPGGKLLVAVLAEHVAGDGLVIHAGLAGQRAQQAGGVEAGAGAEDAAAGKTQTLRQLIGDDVAGVGDVDEDTVKAAVLDLLDIAAHGGDGELHLSHAVGVAAQKVDLADAVDDDIALAEVREVTGAHTDAVGHVGDGVAQVLYFAGELLILEVDEDQLVRNA